MKHRHGFAVVFFVGLWMTLSTVTYGQRADGEFVRRLPDGSLELTSVYPGDTITFPPGELGSLIEEAWQSGGALPFEGVSLAVVTLQAGERGAISGGILNWVPAFNELTGADVQVVQRPFNDIAPVMFNDLIPIARSSAINDSRV